MPGGSVNMIIPSDGTWHPVTTSTPATGLMWPMQIIAANNGSLQGIVRIAVSQASLVSQPTAQDIITPGVSLNPQADSFEQNALLIQPNERVWALATVANISIRANWAETSQ